MRGSIEIRRRSPAPGRRSGAVIGGGAGGGAKNASGRMCGANLGYDSEFSLGTYAREWIPSSS